jgi:hypothetical protein
VFKLILLKGIALKFYQDHSLEVKELLNH